MINFSISPVQVLWWADLSGDRNPVHFDKAHARRAGAEEPFAHGMLALLSTQGRLLKALEELPVLPFTLYASFRQPIPIGQVLGLKLKQANPSCRFSLDDIVSAKSLILGSMRTGVVLPERPGHVRKLVSRQSVREVRTSIETALSVVVPDWMALEVVGFAEYLRMNYSAAGHQSNTVMHFDPDQSTILQTHHNMTLFRDLTSCKLDSPVIVEIAEDEVVTLEGMSSISSSITVFSQEVPMVRMEVKILAKDTF